MADAREPLHRLSSENLGPIVVIECVLLACCSAVVTLIRIWLAAVRKFKFDLDDATYLAANVFAITSSILYSLATDYGLGKHISTVSAENVDKFFKMMYAAQLLEIFAMFFAKASMVLLINKIFPSYQRALSILVPIITAWGLFSIFAVAFQCNFPRPWKFDLSRCPTHGKLLYLVIIFNALTDILLAFWTVPRIRRLSIPRGRKGLVIFLFSLKIYICIPAVAELVLLHTYLNSTDQTRSSYSRVLLNQAMVYISVISTAIPRINQFLSSLHSVRADIRVPDFEINGSVNANREDKSEASSNRKARET